VRDYELGIVLSPEASEEQTKAILDRVSQVVQTNGGQVVKVNAWGRRRLAYPIERHRDGLYFFLDLSLTPQSVLEVDRNLKVTEEVIRHLIVKRDPKAIAMQRAREAQAEAAAPAEAQTAALAEAEAQPESLTEEAGLVPEAEDDAEVIEPIEAEELEDAPAAVEEAESEA
jgi:small subunit ribosomal protein S6